MKFFALVAAGIGAFLIEAGIIYAFASGEYVGAPLILVVGGGFLYLALYATRAVKRASVEVQAQGASDRAEPVAVEAQEEPHVGPTIWPLVLSVGAAVLAIGAVASRWALLVGAVVVVVAGTGWFVDIIRQWRHVPTPSTPPTPPGPATDMIDVPERR